ncbi:hypothetical protein NP554_29110 [Pseudomonas asiatica]|jgi:hypothetical protein|uniref:Uncharacterized protein n=1 Tax=Pseudomonas asiatica TaxID=2219225 RepID=A0A9X4DJV1_9PSED|nr:hypothetical protein [Pseudomonas asiatica]MDD2115858.1 hypothetical protein [Pseudomonas asiatica]
MLPRKIRPKVYQRGGKSDGNPIVSGMKNAQKPLPTMWRGFMLPDENHSEGHKDGMPQQTPKPMIDRSQVEQNRYLDYCLKHKVEISIILISGTHFIGFILQHDRKGLLLGGKREDKPVRFISKGYIALVRPNKDQDLELFLEYRGMGTFLQRKRQKQALKKLEKKNAGKPLPPSGPARKKLTLRPAVD